jgi:hypothetical protein
MQGLWFCFQKNRLVFSGNIFRLGFEFCFYKYICTVGSTDLADDISYSSMYKCPCLQRNFWRNMSCNLNYVIYNSTVIPYSRYLLTSFVTERKFESLKTLIWAALLRVPQVIENLSSRPFYLSSNELKRVATWTPTLREEHRLRVFENRVLRRIFGPIRDEVTRGWRNPHNEELHNLCSLPSIIRMIKSRRMRWAGHVARVGRSWMHVGFRWEIQKERDHSEDLNIYGRIVLR